MIFIDWYQITVEALSEVLQGFVNFLPLLIGALVILIVGWFIAGAVGRVVTELLRRIKFNQVFERGSWKRALEKAEFKVDPSGFIGVIFKWVLVIVFLMAAVEILGLPQFANFLDRVVGFLPNIIVAVLIFVVTVIIADIVEKIVRAGVEGMQVGYGQIVSAIVKWSIWTFAFLAILMQLRVAPALIHTLFQGLIALIVISGGLAFGLGGKEVAGEILRDLKNKLKG